MNGVKHMLNMFACFMYPFQPFHRYIHFKMINHHVCCLMKDKPTFMLVHTDDVEKKRIVSLTMSAVD